MGFETYEGRKVKVQLVNGAIYIGTLINFENDIIVIKEKNKEALEISKDAVLSMDEVLSC